MKRIVGPLLSAALLLSLPPLAASAQTDRAKLLQGGHNLVVTNAKKQSDYYLVTSERSQMLHRRDGKLVIGRDTFAARDISMRLKPVTRFAIDEDSTAFAAKYNMDHGLLAFRRTMNVGVWNTIVAPFSLTGSQIRDTFGDDAQLAAAKGVTDGTLATVEFGTVGLDTDDVVMEAGSYYLLKPTREADIPEGETTSVAYGADKVAGPLYLIPNVSVTKGKTAPDNKLLRSATDTVRVRLRGTYASRDLSPSTRDIYVLSDKGTFTPLLESTDVKGFRYWAENTSSGQNVKFSFAIDGIASDDEMVGLAEIENTRQQEADRVYDLQGRRLNAQRQKGLYIVNGKKTYIK